MPEQLRDLFHCPSRLIGWGFVALVHVLLWQLLTQGINVFRIAPVMEVVQVSFMNDEAPPVTPPQPPVPKLEAPITSELFVPLPEVSVAQASTTLVATTPVPPVAAAETMVVVTTSEPHSTRLSVVSDAEIDYLVKPEVRYPLAAKRAGEQGTVLLSVIVNTRGMVDYISVYQTSGYQRLDDAAVRAVRSMRVKPYLKNGIAQPIEVRVPVEFS